MSKSVFRTKKIDSILAEGDSSAHGGHGLKRILSLRDLTFFGIAAIIGAGSFSSLGGAVFKGGPGVVLLFVITAIACAFTAFCYSEFASRIPVAGSAYTYAYASFGELFAWIIGWALIMEYSIGNIYVAFSWSDYFTSFLSKCNINVPAWLCTSYMEAKDAVAANSNNKELISAWNDAPMIGNLRFIVDAPALAINIFITWLVYKGVKESRNFSNIMVVLKLSVVALVIFVGGYLVFANGLTANWLPANDHGEKLFMPNGFSGVMAAVSGVFFAYIGFDAVSVLAEESKNPQRDLPKGMILSLVICTVIYILLTLVLTGAAHYKQFDGIGDPLAFIFEKSNLNIGWMQFLVAICAVVAMTSVLLVFQMGQPRIWMSMSRDGLLPPVFQKIHPKYKTPSFATIVTGFVVGVPILFTDKTFVLDFTSIATLFAFVLVCGGILLIPFRAKEHGKFHMPYFNSRFIFPLIVAGTITFISLYDKHYFSNLFSMNLTQTEEEHTIQSLINNTNEESFASFLVNDKEQIKIASLVKNKSLDEVCKAIVNNNKIIKDTCNSFSYNEYKTKNNAVLNASSNNGNDAFFHSTGFDFEKIILTMQLNIKTLEQYYPSLKEKLLSVEDTALYEKFLKQDRFYQAVQQKFNDTAPYKFPINEKLNQGLQQLKLTDMQNAFDKDLNNKRTANVSNIIFWFTAIVLSVFAYRRKWSLIPLLGLVTCLFLLTGMTALNWAWFAGWLALGLVFYLLYGKHKSKLHPNNQ